MPNKKAQRNNNRKTKRAPPKQGRVPTKLDKMKNTLLLQKGVCKNPTCNMCQRLTEMIKRLNRMIDDGQTDLCNNPDCSNPDCSRTRELYNYHMNMYLGIRPNGKLPNPRAKPGDLR